MLYHLDIPDNYDSQTSDDFSHTLSTEVSYIGHLTTHWKGIRIDYTIKKHPFRSAFDHLPDSKESGERLL